MNDAIPIESIYHVRYLYRIRAMYDLAVASVMLDRRISLSKHQPK